MEKLQYHIRRGSMIIIAGVGCCAIIGVSMLVGWGLAWIVARFI